MKKVFKIFVLFLLCICVSFPFTGCSLDFGDSSSETGTSSISHKVAYRPTAKADESMSDSEASYYEITNQYFGVAKALLNILNAKYNLQKNLTIDDFIATNTIRYDSIYSGISLTPKLEMLDCIRFGLEEYSYDTNYYVLNTDKAWKWTVGLDYEFVKKSLFKSVIDHYEKEGIDDAIIEEDETTPYLKIMKNFEENVVFLNINQTVIETIETGYYTQYSAMYSGLLEMAIIDILLGNTPESFEISFNSEGAPTVLDVELPIDYNKWTDGNNSLGILSEKRSEKINIYNRISTSIGFTTEQVEKVVDYIFEEVIGENAQNAGYALYNKDEFLEDAKVLLLSRSYGQVGADVRDEDVESEYGNKTLGGAKNGAHSAYSRTQFVDCNKNTFSLSSDENVEGLGNITAREYESVVIMNSEEKEAIGSIYIAIETNRDLTMACYTRYYNSAEKKVYCGNRETFDVKAGTFALGSDVGIDLLVEVSEEAFESSGSEYHDIELGEFVNSSNLVASTSRNVTAFNRVYKTIDSSLGGTVAVLDEQYAQSDFLELVFEVKRDSSDINADYSFRFAVIAHFFDIHRLSS